MPLIFVEIVPQARRQGRTQIDNIVDTVAAGEARPALLERLKVLETEKQQLKNSLADTSPEPVKLLPNASENYVSKVNTLRDALNDDEIRDEATKILRELIDAVVLHLVGSKLQIKLKGELANLIGFAHTTDAKKPGSAGDPGCTKSLVAGARCHLYRTWAKRPSALFD